ncbi:MAG TPA: MFS transporter [Pyrinomonadaceae bacterium]|jgi:UMF1 family MFS transporter
MNNQKNDRREIFGWITFDWANHAFFTLVLGVLIGKYITTLAHDAVGENGAILTLGGHDLVTEKSLYPFAVGLSVFLQVFFLPVLGAIADYTHLKKTFMAFFCYLGSLACVLMFFVQGNLYLLGAILFVMANLSAGASIVFFNSFLTDITTEERRDKVSSWGFATGYAGGALTLILSFIFLYNTEYFGVSKGLAVRICLLAAGIWWGGFSLITFALLKSRQPVREVPEGKHFVVAGLGELTGTFRELFKLKHTLHFLIAYLLYNDGIQTVIAISAVFISNELHVDDSALVISFLIAQVVGIIGSLAFERIAHYTSSKTAILISLVIWSAIVIYAYGFLHTLTQAYLMSGAIGFVLGGSQALSRSLFSRMIPAGRESAFFGIYAISERGTSWLGPIVFGVVAQMTDSYRPAILTLIVFFVVGSIILFFADTKRAIREAQNESPGEAVLQT